MSNETAVNSSGRPVVDFSTLELKKDAQANERYYQPSEHLKVVECVITRDKSPLKGATYFRLEFLTLGTALAFFGDDVVLDLVNSRVSGAVYSRAAASINNKIRAKKEGESDKDYNEFCRAESARLVALNPVLVSPEDAYNFQPGDRELTPKTIISKIAKLTKAGLEFFQSGKITEGQDTFEQVKQLNIRLAEMLGQIEDVAVSAAEAAAGQ